MVKSYWLSVTGYQEIITTEKRVTGYGLRVSGYGLRVAGCELREEMGSSLRLTLSLHCVSLLSFLKMHPAIKINKT